MLSAIIIAAIAVAIFLGYKTKLNTGLFLYCFCLHHWMSDHGTQTKTSHFFFGL